MQVMVLWTQAEVSLVIVFGSFTDLDLVVAREDTRMCFITVLLQELFVIFVKSMPMSL